VVAIKAAAAMKKRRLLPKRYANWKTFRNFHGVVWRHTARQSWLLVWIFVMYSIQIVFTAFEISTFLRVTLWFCGATIVLTFGSRLGRNYNVLETTMRQHHEWTRIQNELRKKMIEDGMTPEEADTKLWQLDIEMEQRWKGKSDG
jgi:hypothetical protein